MYNEKLIRLINCYAFLTIKIVKIKCRFLDSTDIFYTWALILFIKHEIAKSKVVFIVVKQCMYDIWYWKFRVSFPFIEHTLRRKKKKMMFNVPCIWYGSVVSSCEIKQKNHNFKFILRATSCMLTVKCSQKYTLKRNYIHKGRNSSWNSDHGRALLNLQKKKYNLFSHSD